MLGFCCWYDIFLDAYTYSTRYLLFIIALIIISILSVWIFEKPRFYKLIFKRSKHSNILDPTPEPSATTFNLSHNDIVDTEPFSTPEDKKIMASEKLSAIINTEIQH